MNIDQRLILIFHCAHAFALITTSLCLYKAQNMLSILNFIFTFIKVTQILQAFGQENKLKHGNQLWVLFMKKEPYIFANFGMQGELQIIVTLLFLLFYSLYSWCMVRIFSAILILCLWKKGLFQKTDSFTGYWIWNWTRKHFLLFGFINICFRISK